MRVRWVDDGSDHLMLSQDGETVRVEHADLPKLAVLLAGVWRRGAAGTLDEAAAAGVVEAWGPEGG